MTSETCRSLLSRLTELELTQLVFDHYQAVFETWGAGQGRAEKEQGLIDWVVRRPGEDERLARLVNGINSTGKSQPTKTMFSQENLPVTVAQLEERVKTLNQGVSDCATRLDEIHDVLTAFHGFNIEDWYHVRDTVAFMRSRLTLLAWTYVTCNVLIVLLLWLLVHHITTAL